MGTAAEERELVAVRKRLDSLNTQRLWRPLDREARQVYDTLCAIERQLLDRLHGPGAAADAPEDEGQRSPSLGPR
jgi:hypothetical protein